LRQKDIECRPFSLVKRLFLELIDRESETIFQFVGELP
jgi:hypothetical protein